MGWALRALAERDETEDQLRLLYEKTKDPTPQERRALAREIALVIPDENEGIMQGRPDPLWLQFLRAFARRELGLAGPSSAFAAPSPLDGKTVKAEELNNRIRSAIEMVLDKRRGNQEVLLNKTAVAEQLQLTRQGLEAAMKGCGLQWEPYGLLLHGAKKNA